MKLSNIFLSTLAVLLCCTACSKDEESFKGKDADASLSIAVKAAGSAVTKGFHPNDENELAGEAKVNNLSVLVFDESGAQLIGYGWQATNSEGEASILNVPAMTMRAQIVIVSNTPESSLAGVTSYSDFESKLAQLADQSQSNLVMSSPVITTQAPLVKGDNYLGYASCGKESVKEKYFFHYSQLLFTSFDVSSSFFFLIGPEWFPLLSLMPCLFRIRNTELLLLKPLALHISSIG